MDEAKFMDKFDHTAVVPTDEAKSVGNFASVPLQKVITNSTSMSCMSLATPTPPPFAEAPSVSTALSDFIDITPGFSALSLTIPIGAAHFILPDSAFSSTAGLLALTMFRDTYLFDIVSPGTLAHLFASGHRRRCPTVRPPSSTRSLPSPARQTSDLT